MMIGLMAKTFNNGNSVEFGAEYQVKHGEGNTELLLFKCCH